MCSSDLGAEKLTKYPAYTKVLCKKSQEDGQMMFCKKIPLWQTPMKTAALALLDEFRNMKKARSGVEWNMCGNGTNRETHLNKIA